MTSEELKKIRDEFKQLKDRRDEILEIQNEIAYLEEKEDVKRYLKLIDLFNEKTLGRNSRLDKLTDEQLITIALSKVEVTSSEQVYVYIGTYKYGCECDIVHGAQDILVDRSNCNADYVVYKNLESRYNETLEVPYKKADDFEKKHTVIFPVNVLNRYKYFYNLQKEYFETMILKSPDEANMMVNKLVKKF